jgi:membrane-associated phospholipid phosphatase
MRTVVLTILQGGSSRGAAFPSSHVAVAVTQSLVMLRFRRPLGLGVAVTSVLLAFGAVYGGFHYAIDAFAGAAVGVAAWLASGALQRAFQRGEFGFAPARPPV